MIPTKIYFCERNNIIININSTQYCHRTEITKISYWSSMDIVYNI